MRSRVDYSAFQNFRLVTIYFSQMLFPTWDFRHPLINEEPHHACVLVFGQAILISFFRIEMIKMKLRYLSQIQVLTYDEALR